MESCIGFKLKMAPSMHVTNSLILLFAIAIPRVVVGQHQPYFFNYQPHQQQQQPQYQQNAYQPFTNAPPGTFYTPSFGSHAPGSSSPSGPTLLNNFFGDGFSPAPTAPAPNSLVPYPTQVTTLDGSRHHLSPQPYQPVGNSLIQQTPTVPTTTSDAFRPSPFLNHHTHIVNGLPRQQFFGNNYAFFRERHGLQLPPTTGPFIHQNTIQTGAAPTASAPSPTPEAQSLAKPSALPSKASESKPNPAVKTLALDIPSSPSPPPTTQSTFLSRFPFNGPSTFSPATYQQQQSYNKPVAPATTPAPRTFPTAQATTASISSGRVSPSFQFSQFFPETDPVNSNELVRQPLFQADEEEEEEEEDDSYTLNNNANSNNNNNNNYYSNQARQVTPQRPQQQYVSSPPITASPVPAFKSQQQTSFNSGGTLNNNNALSSEAKDEPTPVRVHNTQPIRIVFNYEQAAQALEETPGVRVVIAHTEKNNLTENEFSTTTRPYVPAPSPSDFPVTSPRSAVSPAVYQSQSTTQRPNDYYATYRPVASSTYRPAQPFVSSTPRPTPPQRPSPPVTRFQYQPVNVPYNTQTTQDEGTTAAAALENLALELEGRFGSTGRPNFISQQPVYETVATLATEPTTTESPLQSYKRGGKKYLVVPSGGDKVYRAQEPRVVVNDLANILVQTVQPGGHYSATPPSTFPRQTFRDYEQPIVGEIGQQVDEDLSEEIAHLSQQIRQDFPTTTTTIPTTTTIATTRRPPIRSSPQPRVRPTVTPRLLRITTYRPPFTYPSTFSTTTNPPPPPPTTPAPIIEQEVVEILPEVNNQLSSDPPSLSARKQPQRYYYNDKSLNGVSGAHQRYEYNGVDETASAPPPQQDEQQRPQKALRRRPRPRGRLIAGSPPRSVQVNGVGPHGHLGPVLGPNGLPPQLYGPGIPLAVGPGGPLGPVPPGAPLQGPVFRVGPRGRLLRRKSRPRAQLQGQEPSLAPSAAPSIAPPPSPSALPPFSPIPQDIRGPGGPFSTQLPPLYSPTPFVPQEVPLVTTFRPGPPPNVLVQQSLVDDQEERKSERPGTFRSRFRFAPAKPTSASVEDDDDEGASNQYESEEEAPVVVQQKRRFSSTTTSTTEKPVERAVVSDRANILQRQIRFNRNRKNQKNN